MFDVDTSHEKLCRSRRAETEIVQRSITIVYNLINIRPDLYTLELQNNQSKKQIFMTSKNTETVDSSYMSFVGASQDSQNIE